LEPYLLILGAKDMAEKHKLGKDGVLEDGVSHYPADERDLRSYQDAQQRLSEFRTPLLIHANDPHEKLFVACFDGTGNDANSDPEHATNVARVRDQIDLAKAAGNTQIARGYVEGPGTQKNFFVRTWDGARGHTYEERLEHMYQQFIDQAWKWHRDDPDVQIRLADMGFSRGAEQAAGFARLVHERGIQDPSGAVYKRDSNGDIIGVTYTTPPLVAPGQTAQAVGLFDPVGTGEPIEKHDRRLPPSVISAFQITAEDERRSQFKSSLILDPGFSADGRFLNVMVGGAHSDIGGSYHHDGLGILAGNLMTDYLNGLSDTRFLEKRAVPDDPNRFVVHRSEEGLLGLYKLTPLVDRRLPEGFNERLVPREDFKFSGDAYNPEPGDEMLKGRFGTRPIPIGPLPAPAKASPEHARTAAEADDPAVIVDRLLAATKSGDNAAFRDATRRAADHDAARELREHAIATVDQQLASAQQQTAAQQAAPQQEVQSQEALVRRHAVPMH
jgi:hypothetical protein